VIAERLFDTAKDTAMIAPARDGLRLIGAGGNGKLVDAPQLTEIAPKILHSNGCFEAV
jgi:hypothetical protein